MLVKEFREKLYKGLGSAALFLQNNPSDKNKFHNAILNACIHNTAYDAQCEGSRAEYLWDIIRLYGDAKNLQNEIIDRLPQIKDGYDKLQIYRLAKYFIQDGNVKALQAIKKEFSYDVSWNCFIGAEEIIEIEKEKGLIFVAETIGKKLLSDSEYFEDDIILDFAIEQFGKDRVYDLLKEESKTNINVNAYYVSVCKYKAEKIKRSIKVNTYNDILELLKENQIRSSYAMLGRWGLQASDEDFDKAAYDFLNIIDKKMLIPYLYMFSKRAFPLKPDKIIELANSKDKDIHEPAILALRNIKDVRIHDLAANLIKMNQRNYEVIDLFVNNYSEEDYILLENILNRRHNRHMVHYIGMSLLKVFENNATPNSQNIMVGIYQRDYCPLCRERCVKIMIANEILPDWIMTEAEYDCNLDTRMAVKEYKLAIEKILWTEYSSTNE